MVKKTTQEQRRELGAFLISHRGRLDPEEFGMPKSSRRTPGLRREEVAMLAGVSVSWYTWLEQGREIKPSSEALQRIAKVLRLNRVESSHLFALSPREEPVLRQVDKGVSDGLEMLVGAINPVPAYVRNARLDILAWNDAIADLFSDDGSLQPHERNTLRLLVRYQPYRTLRMEREQMARGRSSDRKRTRLNARH